MVPIVQLAGQFLVYRRKVTRVNLKPDFTIIHHVMGPVQESTKSYRCEEVECGFLAFLGVFVGVKFAGEGDVGFYLCIEVLWE